MPEVRDVIVVRAPKIHTDFNMQCLRKSQYKFKTDKHLYNFRYESKRKGLSITYDTRHVRTRGRTRDNKTVPYTQLVKNHLKIDHRVVI